jgi:hypothetical protein
LIDRIFIAGVAMSDTDQTGDLNSTINVLQQDLPSTSASVAIALIERWEEHLQGTELFDDLSQLKQAILNNDTSHIAELLNKLSKEVSKTVTRDNDDLPKQVVAKAEQISRLLAQAGESLS